LLPSPRNSSAQSLELDASIIFFEIDSSPEHDCRLNIFKHEEFFGLALAQQSLNQFNILPRRPDCAAPAFVSGAPVSFYALSVQRQRQAPTLSPVPVPVARATRVLMSSDPAPIAAASQTQELNGRPPAALALGIVLAFAAAKLLMHFLVTFVTPYEVHRDEFLYLAMGRHLQLWKMDFPPAIALLAELARFLFGNNLFAIRFFPAIGGTLIVILTGLLAREFGGGRFAQGVAMLAVLTGPLFMRAATLFQPVVLDQLWWTLGLFGLTRVVHGSPKPGWVLVGVACGFGLLTKFSILFFAFSMCVALLLTKNRSLFLTKGPWIAAGTALVLGSPSIIGQIRLGLPVLIHMQVLRDSSSRTSPQSSSWRRKPGCSDRPWSWRWPDWLAFCLPNA
jgi:hypothetical protein